MKDVLRLSLPLTLWLIWFSGLYGLHGLVCAGTWGALPGPGGLSLGRAALLAAATGALGTQGLALALLGHARLGAAPGFPRRASLSLAAVALLATAWTSLPVALLPTCQGANSPAVASS